MSSVEAAHHHCHQCESSDNHNNRYHAEPSLFRKVVEKTYIFAIVAFSIITDLDLFIPSFLFGLMVGVYNHYNEKNECKHGHSVSACSSEILAQLLSIKLPHLIALTMGVAVLIQHIEHHPSVFVPLVGIWSGAWFIQRTFEYFKISNDFFISLDL